ncbi:MAG: NAD(P)H-dependent oxidoreductase [Paracoccus sp. (in: a-proteobacteria)]|uniref:NAD(P)H-dependent oxidoreductase n=1 Tax=Paracoccus sp. TaxID=267 RepID=UPI0026DF9025|nr:NAD(P)H-dependent oxidoreductase [Paracoccus sp. (in: a-proteobacteria)]MDO5619829.1 NAD(P)H-dependent oxidoreductase [Paracoccus sp. (in: a-proteobacteria)]
MSDEHDTQNAGGAVSRRNIFKAGAGLALGAAVPSLMTGTSAQAQVAGDTMFVNLETVYGDNMRGFDRATERRIYQQMDRMVLMFPIHWFNMTPMMKAYMNEIWGSGGPPELRGKELFAVVTTGGGADACRPEGRLGFTIGQVLTPLAASANYTGMTYSEPLAFLGSAGASGAALRQYQDALAARLHEPPRRGWLTGRQVARLDLGGNPIARNTH